MRDAVFLDFILQQFQKANNNASFAQPSPLKTSIDVYGNDPTPDSNKVSGVPLESCQPNTMIPSSPPPLTLPPHIDANDQRNNSTTGTRKGIKPEALLLLDAPTQPRKYTGPSATSPKDLSSVSTVLTGKRPRAEALEEEEDELDADEPLAPDMTESEQIEWKRRKNVLAARRSRKRKLEYQRELEESVEKLTLEKDQWQARALTLRQILQSHGIPFNEFQD